MLGDACADLVVRTDLDEYDAKRQSSPEVTCGGSAANTATLLARLGKPVAFVGSVGRDSFGGMISGQLSGAGDAFNAGFIAATLDGLTLAEALEWGNATAGMTLKASRTSGVFGRDDVITLIRQQSKLTSPDTL